MKRSLIVLLSSVSLSLVFSCNKDCYNPSLEKHYETIACPKDCPGVIGCDGKTYCNECEANKRGVAVKN